MEKKQELKLDKRAFDPMFCDSGDEFIKLTFMTLMAFAGDPEGDVEHMTLGIRVLLHEYLAMVLRGEIEPYIFDDDFIKSEKPGFRHTMSLANYALAMAGVDTIEAEGGKIEIDYDKLMKLFGHGREHCAVKKQKK